MMAGRARSPRSGRASSSRGPAATRRSRSPARATCRGRPVPALAARRGHERAARRRSTCSSLGLGLGHDHAGARPRRAERRPLRRPGLRDLGRDAVARHRRLGRHGLFGSHLHHRLRTQLDGRVAAAALRAVVAGGGRLTGEQILRLPGAARAAYQHAYVHALTPVFRIAAVVALVGFAVSWLLRGAPAARDRGGERRARGRARRAEGRRLARGGRARASRSPRTASSARPSTAAWPSARARPEPGRDVGAGAHRRARLRRRALDGRGAGHPGRAHRRGDRGAARAGTGPRPRRRARGDARGPGA